MTIRVYVVGEPPVNIEIKEGTTVAQIAEMVDVSPSLYAIISGNGVPKEYEVTEGDNLSFVPSAKGGCF